MSNTTRINITRREGEFYPNEVTDYEWARTQRAALLEEYGAGVVLIFQKQVVGVGKTLAEAQADAEKKLPVQSGEITPIIELVGQRHPFFRITATPEGKS